jgi:SepF-like predicted cell division protein (DUF552 family)
MGFLGKIFRGDTIPDSDYGEEELQEPEESNLYDGTYGGNTEPFGTRSAPEKVVQFTKPATASAKPAVPFASSPFASMPQEPPVGDLLRSGSFGESTRQPGGTSGGGSGGKGPGSGFGSMPESADAYVVFKRLQDFQTASAVADRLIEGKIVILNLENCDAEVARRVMDFIGGVAYACSSMVRRIAGRVFMITPKGVNSDGEFFDEARAAGPEIRYDD